jgi:TonB-dependent SusC/RagA subfamily outer membrane receptor
MSPLQRRALVSSISTSLVFGLVFAPIVGCHQGRTSRPKAAPTTVSDGYDESAKTQATGGQSVTFDEASKRQVSRVEELLENFPGVQVQRTGDGGYSVSIRGASGSFMAGEQPLFVIDGIPYEVGPGRGLGWLNPMDVTRIDVLKNPAETAIYGVRGSNGVIVITTQRKR